MAVPLLASGTSAGAQISNTATATYDDPNQPGTSINTTSNTVVVTVAEVAGITVTPLAVTDVDGDTVVPEDVIHYDFRITNVGNDPSQIFIPNAATVTGPGTSGTLQIIGYSDTNGTVQPITPIDVTTGGTTRALGVTIPGNPLGSIPSGFSLIVRVPVTVNLLAPSNALISVTLGDTPPNDNSANTQNQPYNAAANNTDVYTADNDNGVTNETDGAPSNGQREASARQEVRVGSQSQAFAAVLKSRTAYETGGTPALNDDLLTYSLTLRVDATAPAGSTGLTPARLLGTPLQVDSVVNSYILVSDAIPVGTRLEAAPTLPAALTAAGWQVVYTNGTAIANDPSTAWVTNPATIGGVANVTRIGFIQPGAIATNSTITGFSFQVRTSGIAVGATTATVANIAQLFGRTEGGGTTLVYDESGDTTPSNYNDNGTPGSNTPTNGIANPGQNGVDTNNNNTGTGPGGEDNVFTLAAPGSILNGPQGQPGAVGPTNNNDDFTNRSTPIAAGIAPNPPGGIDPDAITFINTVNNPSTTTVLSNVLLVPDDGAATGTVPTNTLVTLTYGGQTATYRYNGTDFIFQSGTALNIPTLAPLESLNYTVQIDLPAGTTLSTDTGNGFPVPLVAFVDSPTGTPGNIPGRPDATDTTQNTTINRVYTGFLRLVKEARILDANGQQIEGFSPNPSTVNIRPGNIIEYRITYTNISTPPAGAGNRTLSASNVVITEDGAAGTNNWARDIDSDGVLDTSNVTNTATASSGAIAFLPSGDQSGTTAATDVTRYVNTLGVIVEPQTSGTFTFRRRIN